jgi:hypothetical protein
MNPSISKTCKRMPKKIEIVSTQICSKSNVSCSPLPMLGRFVCTFGCLSLSLFIGGCGGEYKFQSVVNEPSGDRISIRYVSGTKSVRIRDEKKGILFDFTMAVAMPRVNDQKIGVHAKRFDFGDWLKHSQTEWIDLWADSKTPVADSGKCPDSSYRVPVEAEAQSGQVREANFYQKPDGTIGLKVYPLSNPELVMVDFKASLPGGRFECATTWKPDAQLVQYANSLLATRDQYLITLAQQAGFDASQMGKKLKRADTQSQSAEASALSVTQYDRTDGRTNAVDTKGSPGGADGGINS